MLLFALALLGKLGVGSYVNGYRPNPRQRTGRGFDASKPRIEESRQVSS
jgi:hypothetical protein